MLTASYVYSGLPDYFGGYGCKDSEHLLYAFYGPNTSLADIIDGLVEDSWTGPASESLPEEVTDSDVRDALLETMLNDKGRADYSNGALAECSEACEVETKCDGCGAKVGREDWPDCPECGMCVDILEPPIFVVVLEYKKGEG